MFVARIGGCGYLDPHCFGHQCTLGREAEAALPACGEIGGHFGHLPERHFDRVLARGGADLEHDFAFGRGAIGHQRAQFGHSLACQGIHRRADCRFGCFVERQCQGRLAQHAAPGEAHAVSREQAGERVDHDRADTQFVRHQAGMLAARAAETRQRGAADVVPSPHRDRQDRMRHLRDRDANEALGGLLARESGGRDHRV